MAAFFCLLFQGFASLAYAVPVSVEVDWANWSSDNRVVIKSPAGATLATICDPNNCFNEAANTSYQNTFTFNFPEGLDYIIELEDSFGDAWNGTSLVRVFSDSRLVFQDDGPDVDFDSYTFDVSAQAANDSRSCTALTGAWSGGSATTSASVGVTASLSTQAGGSFAFQANDNLSTVGAFSEPSAEGHTSLTSRFSWDTSASGGSYAHEDGVTGTITFSFDEPIVDPVFHFDRIGGIDSGTANGAHFSLTSAGTLVRLSGTPQFEVHDKFFQRTPHEVMAAGATGETSQTTNAGMAAGSFYVSGVHSSVSFSTEGIGLEGTGGDVFEVAVCAEPTDFSDAPLTYGDATHALISDLRIGAVVDGDSGSLASPDAEGDDNNGSDDEDGVSFPLLQLGSSVTIPVTVTQTNATDGNLQAWIDWNSDGDFDDLGEQLATNLQSANAGTSTINVPVIVPITATPGLTFARFRWSSTLNLGVSTSAPDGEVEDYQVTVVANTTPTPVCPATGSNIAPTGTANQSSTRFGGVAARAIDENTNGVYNNRSVTHTNTEAAPWWDLDLDSDRDIDTITVWNRTDLCCVNRLDDFHLFTSSTPFPNTGNNIVDLITILNDPDVFKYQHSGSVDTNTTVPVVESNRYVRIQLPGVNRILSLAEVQVNSCLPGIEAAKAIEVYDPANTDLYALPGNDVIYTITVSNSGSGAADTNTIEIVDLLPPEIEFWNGDIDAGGPDTYPGSSPVGFRQTSGTGMSLTYGTDVRFGTGTSAPTDFNACSAVSPDGSYRPDLTFICLNPKGVLGTGDPNPEITLSFRARIK